jgi:hypothetical protein
MRRIWLICAALLGLASPAWGLAGTLNLLGTSGELAPGDTTLVDLRVSSSSAITGVQFTLNYDVNVVRFANASIGQDLGGLGFTIYGVNPNPAVAPVVAGTNRVVAIQIYKQAGASFTGTNLRAAKVKFVVQPGYCRTSPIAFDATCSHTQLVTVQGQTICSAQLTLSNTSATQRCISDAPTPAANLVRLLPNVPNPFNPTTRVGFELEAAARVHLAVYRADGRPVRVLADGSYAAGPHSVTWDGRDMHGTPLASGVYWCQLQVADEVLARPMVLVR